jgi:hypothetical protein
MPSVTGFTSARTQAIEDAIITSAAVVAGHLIFTRHDGTTFDAGDINGGQQIPHTNLNAVSSTGGTTDSTSFVVLDIPLSVSGFQKYRDDTKLIVEAHTGIYNNDEGGFYEVACRIGATDTVLFNGYGLSGPKSGARQISGLVAATYTISLVYRKGTSGIGTTIEGRVLCRNELVVTETF